MMRAARIFTATGWLALCAVTALAQEIALPLPVLAAFDACTAPGQSAPDRFAALEMAGWRVASDEPIPRAFATLIHSERFSFLEPGTPRYANFIQTTVPALRDGRDAGLSEGAVLSVADMQPVLAAKVSASVQMSPPGAGSHLVVLLLGNGLDRMTMECNLSLTTPLDDATQTALAARRGFDASHAFVPPPKSGSSNVVYKQRGESGPEDPWTLRFRSFDPDGVLARMSQDFALPVRIGGMIVTISKDFPTK
jgi:hypothetical protein